MGFPVVLIAFCRLVFFLMLNFQRLAYEEQTQAQGPHVETSVISKFYAMNCSRLQFNLFCELVE